MERLTAVRRVEGFLDRAWPPRETATGEEWIARFSGGMHRRLNSASVWSGELVSILPEIAAWYADRHRPPLFRLTEAAHPELDPYLEAAGYRADPGVLVMSRALGEESLSDGKARIIEHRDPYWADAFARISGYGPQRRRLLGEILERNAGRCGFASITEGGSIVAVGMAVLEGDHAGLFEIAVDPGRRRGGRGARIVASLLAWAREQGAATAFLQVFSDNRPALVLYDRAGFTTHHRYWYRIPPGGLPAGPR